MKLALLALAVGFTALGVLRPAGAAPRAQVVPADLDRGLQLYETDCQTCHMPDGQGQPSVQVPSLHGVGAAAVDFYLSTGRMPEANLEPQAPRKPVSIDAADRAAIVDYVTTTWPGGPDIPTAASRPGDLVDGGDLYRSNCAACHSATGAGAALAHGAYAPSLHRATSLQVAEAVRVGPANMPVFGPGELSDAQVAGIATYVQYLHHPDDRGGLGLGHTGPIAEGFVGLAVGLLSAVAVAAWVGHRNDEPPLERHV